jgi:ApeA N-terminal domain 1
MSDEPLPLDTAIELTGVWWRPGDRDQHAAGRLIYTPGQLRIDLTSGADLLMRRPDDPDGPVPWLHGMTVDGRPVTLHGCHLTKWSLHHPGGVLQEAVVDLAAVGMHASTSRHGASTREGSRYERACGDPTSDRSTLTSTEPAST